MASPESAPTAGIPSTEPALPLRVVTGADDIAWDAAADVVIVGYGGAGICAALETVAIGGSVIAIDRFSGGGATAMSGGIVYAGGTSIQRQNGFNDDAANMQRYLELEVGDIVSAKTLRRFCEDSAPNMTWLEQHGVQFGTTLYEGKTTYPPNGYFLCYTGNEKVEEYAAAATPAPRGHRTLGTGFTGKYLYAPLRKAADAAPITKQLHSTVTRLVADQSGRIIGVELLALPAQYQAEHQKLYDGIVPTAPFKEEKAERANAAARALVKAHGVPRLVRAHRGVILSTGGYVFNLDLLREFVPLLAQNYTSLVRLGSLGDDGSAIRIGRTVGAGLTKPSTMFLGRVQSPPAAFLDGIIVNRNAKRFVNEAVYIGSLGQAIVDQPDGTAWLVLPSKSCRKAVRQILTGGLDSFKLFGAPALLNLILGGTKRASTIERLAEKCGLNPAALRETVTRYDTMVAGAHDADFSKLKNYLKPLGNVPVVAINVSLANRYTFLQLLTLGGLTVDEDTGAVQRTDGSLVAGLYAAGRAAAGLPSNKYVSGLSLSDCVFSGRRAAAACFEPPATTLQPMPEREKSTV